MSYVRTVEHREMMRLLNLGRKASQATRQKISKNHIDVGGENNPMWGKQRTQEVKDAISKAHKGRKQSTVAKQKQILAQTGKKKSIEAVLNMRKSAHRGKDHWNWQGGISNENERIRKSFEYFLWHEACLERDNYTCVLCGIKRGWDKQLKKRILVQVDHIKSFAAYPELRLALDNGRTLCVECHRNTPNYGYKARFEKVVMPYAY